MMSPEQKVVGAWLPLAVVTEAVHFAPVLAACEAAKAAMKTTSSLDILVKTVLW